MSRYRVFIAILLWVLSLEIVASVATRVAKNKYEPFSVEELADMGAHWQFASATQYSDGGTWRLGFEEGSGYIIYVTINFSLGVEHEYREFSLSKSSIIGSDSVEIGRGTDLESKVSDLIEKSWDMNTNECTFLPERSSIVALLKSRDLRITIHNPLR